MPSWTLQWVKERFIAVPLVIRWRKCKVLKQCSLAILGAKLKIRKEIRIQDFGALVCFSGFPTGFEGHTLP